MKSLLIQNDHKALANIGANTHAQIDTHIASTSNPHSVTLAQVGGTTDHTALSNIGTLSHATIDSYLNQAVKTTSSPTFNLVTATGGLNGQTTSGGNLTLRTTSHATKGKILFGTSQFDETTDALGIGIGSGTAAAKLQIGGTWYDTSGSALLVHTGYATIQTSVNFGSHYFQYFGGISSVPAGTNVFTANAAYATTITKSGTGTLHNVYAYYDQGQNAGVANWGFYSATAQHLLTGTTYGSVASGGDLTLNSTTHATKGTLISDSILNTYGYRKVTIQKDATTTTLAVVTGLGRTLVEGRSYSFEAVLFVDADAVGGSKFSMGGTCTATSIIYEIMLLDNTTNAHTITSRQTALNGASGQVGTTAGLCVIKGTILVNAAGTIRPEFAQNVANGTSSVLAGSYFTVRSVT